MSADLKPLLLELLSKTDTLLNDVAALKDGQSRLEEDMRQAKEMLGVACVKELSRLDGRLDQLSLGVSLLRRAAAE
ncbi:hypothetical protein M2352_000174 [Azospirillum fermentarium]|uniref:hypothetical protein n=1 Tax=Azospirillum fermentarium TaxID=1233114 RepID=UPI0022267AF3|nr:hypothetical protein [Azospirillum fermentarium]MCW2244583.1 hypothetical protein [Azospirillum fermentarium]